MRVVTAMAANPISWNVICPKTVMGAVTLQTIRQLPKYVLGVGKEQTIGQWLFLISTWNHPRVLKTSPLGLVRSNLSSKKPINYSKPTIWPLIEHEKTPQTNHIQNITRTDLSLWVIGIQGLMNVANIIGWSGSYENILVIPIIITFHDAIFDDMRGTFSSLFLQRLHVGTLKGVTISEFYDSDNATAITTNLTPQQLREIERKQLLSTKHNEPPHEVCNLDIGVNCEALFEISMTHEWHGMF
jgi:hypothetical protein